MTSATWDDVVAIEAQLCALEVHLERTLLARERVDAGGPFSLWTRLTWGSTARLDGQIAVHLETLAVHEADLRTAEQAWMTLQGSEDAQAAAFRRQSVQHALRVLKAMENDPNPMRPEDLAWVRRVLARVQRVCADLDGADTLSGLTAGIRTAIEDSQAIRNDPRQYVAVGRNSRDMKAHLYAARAEDREDVALLRAAEPLLRMLRALSPQAEER
jgi:hypothetical protein